MGNKFWPSNMHEPIVIGLIFPTTKHRPCYCAKTPLMNHFKKEIKCLFDERKDASVVLKRMFNVSADFRRMTAEETATTLTKPELFVY